MRAGGCRLTGALLTYQSMEGRQQPLWLGPLRHDRRALAPSAGLSRGPRCRAEADAEAADAQALNGGVLPAGMRVLRSRDATLVEGAGSGAVKGLDFGGRVSRASTKNLQLQVSRQGCSADGSRAQAQG